MTKITYSYSHLVTEETTNLTSFCSSLLNIREKFRIEKNYEESDKIRDFLKSCRIKFKDSKDGTTTMMAVEFNDFCDSLNDSPETIRKKILDKAEEALSFLQRYDK